jgi:hypothetical protein
MERWISRNVCHVLFSERQRVMLRSVRSPVRRGRPFHRMVSPQLATARTSSACGWRHVAQERKGSADRCVSAESQARDSAATTSRLKAGYYWRNGMPYTENATLTEHFRTFTLPDGSAWFVLIQIVDDSEYLTQPFIVNYQFKKLPDGSLWTPSACLVN